MRIVLESEEAGALVRHPLVQELMRYSAAPFAVTPTDLPVSQLRLLLDEAGRWMRPRDHVRVDVDWQEWPSPVVIARVDTQVAARDWESDFRQEAHWQRVLAGRARYGAATWPEERYRMVRVVSDDGWAHARYVMPHEIEQQQAHPGVGAVEAVAGNLVRELHLREKLSATNRPAEAGAG